MKLLLHRADEFNADFDRRYRWYLREAGEEVAERFFASRARDIVIFGATAEFGPAAKFSPSIIARPSFISC